MTSDRDPKGPPAPLSGLLAELDKCSRCGECRVVCPVFERMRREKFAAKGKVALLKAAAKGDIGLSDSFYEALGNCLLCMACVDNCSCGVRTDAIVTAGRAAFVQARGLKAAQRLVRRGLLAGPGLRRVASGAQKLLFSRLPGRSGLRARFPLPLLREGQMAPKLAATPFRDRLGDRLGKAGPSGPAQADAPGDTVIYFTGCMADHAYTGIAQAVVDVLEALDVRVVAPRGQSCCGAAMLNMGDRATALEQARDNAAVLATALKLHPGARIVTACSTCGLALKRHHPELLAGDGLEDAARAVAVAAMDIAEYLADVVGPERLAPGASPPPSPSGPPTTTPATWSGARGCASSPRSCCAWPAGTDSRTWPRPTAAAAWPGPIS